MSTENYKSKTFKSNELSSVHLLEQVHQLNLQQEKVKQLEISGLIV